MIAGSFFGRIAEFCTSQELVVLRKMQLAGAQAGMARLRSGGSVSPNAELLHRPTWIQLDVFAKPGPSGDIDPPSFDPTTGTLSAGAGNQDGHPRNQPD
jgi:hypothetical protein